MRLLHTSDWHLGQTFHHYDRTAEHQRFLDWLLDTLDAEDTELLLIAGDVFDNANPSAASQRQLYRFITEARRRRPALAIVMIAGNHDSPARMEAPAPFLDGLGVCCIGQVTRLGDGAIDIGRLVTPVHGADGEVRAWCLAIPFLRPGDVPRPALPEGGSAQADAEVAPLDTDPYRAGVAALYRAALDEALRRRAPDQPVVALGHCHMRGGEASEDSERRIVVGGAEALPPGIFDPAIAYVALGHLHKAQRVGGQEHIRYSGSPLPMSFSEIHYRHQVLSGTIEGDRLQEIRAVPVPRWVPLLRVPEQPAPLDDALAALQGLSVPAPAGQEAMAEDLQPYLQVRVRLDGPEPALRSRIEQALADKPVRLARIEVSAAASGNDATAPLLSLDDLNRVDPAALFSSLYRSRHGGEAPPALLAALHELLHDDEDDTSGVEAA
ncbi:exonuclease SbcCD subunit D C-terminal domain-containing protein [Cupriavidus sp. AU9028]|uniref:exonuclease SbcCD subunit D C-terminal domain-containing protein n=1 Tax=Cupriavidus sp. AU9028 TaxID=2871157 RepID=UPI001C954A22|nr:exonuclease SbcCD subunit D C-terminal domain-containing protein [Cupriavidus sp. AU9028]MBY4896619.1 exonuclease SbcCD subunit D C-terminal domain-containing protein [Cupriavidus sp. AU9028]